MLRLRDQPCHPPRSALSLKQIFGPNPTPHVFPTSQMTLAPNKRVAYLVAFLLGGCGEASIMLLFTF
jgi:hypothetical protein